MELIKHISGDKRRHPSKETKKALGVAAQPMDKTPFFLYIDSSSPFLSGFEILVDGYTSLDRNIILLVSPSPSP